MRRFPGMSYLAPSAVRYRYRLEGYDRHWNEVGNIRSASYTNLPPGDYVFRVVASNNDGVWNEAGAQVRFSLLPHWYQTWWLRTLAVLAVLGLLAALVRLRLRAAHERERDLAREVAQRSDDLPEANARLHRIAASDALTGIANRREFNRRLLLAWDDHAERDAPLAVLLADVDEFKAYNDSYGHLGGDGALGAGAACLAANLRSGAGLVARYGGEEFAVLLPDCDAEAALALARDLVAAVHASALPHRASQVADSLTLSIGAASLRPARDGTPDDLLHAADAALYRAKAEGRDRALPATRVIAGACAPRPACVAAGARRTGAWRGGFRRLVRHHRERIRPGDVHAQHPRHRFLAAIGGEFGPQRQVVADPW